MGIKWADCLPGTSGYDNGGGQQTRAAQLKADNDAIVAQLKPILAQCEADLKTPELDLIREKVELGKTSLAGPPFSIASDEDYPKSNERAAIGKWGHLRENCERQLDSIETVAPSADSHYANYASDVRANRVRAFGHVSELIVLLYEQKITYAEFAKKRHEIDLEADSIRHALADAKGASDDARRAQAEQLAQQEEQNRQMQWSAYMQAMNARTARQTPTTSVNCTSQRLGNTVNTNCY